MISAGHFHGMPLALAMSYVKAAIPVLASISERRLNKLVDPATNDGLPAFLIGNEDGTESGLMIVQYTAAAIVNDLASRAMPASVYSIPTSANAEDHVSMGANEARHVLAMANDLGKVLGLELITAAQALDLRRDMIHAARDLAQRADAAAFVDQGAAADRRRMRRSRADFLAEVDGLRAELADAADFRPGQRGRGRACGDPRSASRSWNATARSTAMSRWRCALVDRERRARRRARGAARSDDARAPAVAASWSRRVLLRAVAACASETRGLDAVPRLRRSAAEVAGGRRLLHARHRRHRRCPARSGASPASSLGDIVDDRPDAVSRDEGGDAAPRHSRGCFVARQPRRGCRREVRCGSLRSFRARRSARTRTCASSTLANVVVLDDVIALPGQVAGLCRRIARGPVRAARSAGCATLPRDRLLIVAAHIPFFDVSPIAGWETFRAADRERLFALLRPFPARVAAERAHAQPAALLPRREGRLAGRASRCTNTTSAPRAGRSGRARRMRRAFPTRR